MARGVWEMPIAPFAKNALRASPSCLNAPRRLVAWWQSQQIRTQQPATGGWLTGCWLASRIPARAGGGLSLGISRCFLNAGCCVALLINVTKARPCRGVRICSFFLTYSLLHLMNRPEVHDVTTKRSSREGNGAYY